MECGEHAGGKPMLQLYLLGRFVAQNSGERIPESAWRRPQARTLIKLLAVGREHRFHREQLVDRFWPEKDLHAAGTSLRQLLYRARRALGSCASALTVHGDVIGLDPNAVWIDVDAFEQGARRGLATGRLEILESAAALYTGELLPEDRYEDWVTPRREELAALHIEVLLAMAEALTQEARMSEAAQRLREVLAIDPADERAHRSLMHLYAGEGDRQQALKQYESCVEMLDEHLGAAPSAEIEALHHQILEGKLTTHQRLLPATLRHRPGPPLIGRDRALELIRADLEAKVQRVGSRRSVVLIGGEAGVGKTRLAAEAARAAQGRGATVLWGSASALEGSVTYGPFAEALEEYLAVLPQKERATLAADQPELGRIIPSLDVRGPIGGDPQSEQMRLFAGVARLLSRLAGEGTLLLVLDDLHQADDASLHLLRYLAKLAVDRRWRIIGTYREEGLQAESGLKTLIVELQRMGAGLHVDLLPLARRECGGLVEAMLAPHAVEEHVFEHIFTHSLGNPFFAIELVESLRERGQLALQDDTWRLAESASPELPRGVTDLIASRIQTLSEQLRAILELAAVAGMTWDPGLLARASGEDEDTVIAVLDRAVMARILEERERGYAFRHPLFRESSYQGLSSPRRARLHGALGHVLEGQQPLDLDALAYHYSRSGDAEKAILYLEQAGDRASEAYANEMAEAHYRELLARLEPLDRPADLARVQEKLGNILLRLARFEESKGALELSARLFRQIGRASDLALVASRVGYAYLSRGPADDGLRYVEEALREVSGRIGGYPLARLRKAHAQLLYYCGQYESALEATERAIEALGPPTDIAEAELLASIHHVRAGCLGSLCRVRAAEEATRKALAAFPEGGDLELLGAIYYSLGWACHLLGKMEDHLAHMQACLEVMRKFGSPARVAEVTSRVGYAHLLAGDWQSARELMDAAVAEVRQIEVPAYGNVILAYRGMLAYALADLPEARSLLQEALDIGWQFPDLAAFAAHYLAGVDMAEEQPDLALNRMEPHLARVLQAKRSAIMHVRILGRTAWACAELGDIERAEDFSARALEIAAPEELPFFRVEALAHRGLVLAAQCRCEEAEEFLGEALALSRAIGVAWRETWILEWWTRLETRRGRSEHARDLAECGAAVLRDHGADAAAARLLALAWVSQPLRR